MLKPQPGGRSAFVLSVEGRYAAFREGSRDRYDAQWYPRGESGVTYALYQGGDLDILENVQWADWSRLGHLLIAMVDGKLQVREVTGLRASTYYPKWTLVHLCQILRSHRRLPSDGELLAEYSRPFVRQPDIVGGPRRGVSRCEDATFVLRIGEMNVLVADSDRRTSPTHRHRARAPQPESSEGSTRLSAAAAGADEGCLRPWRMRPIVDAVTFLRPMHGMSCDDPTSSHVGGLPYAQAQQHLAHR